MKFTISKQILFDQLSSIAGALRRNFIFRCVSIISTGEVLRMLMPLDDYNILLNKQNVYFYTKSTSLICRRPSLVMDTRKSDCDFYVELSRRRLIVMCAVGQVQITVC